MADARRRILSGILLGTLLMSPAAPGVCGEILSTLGQVHPEALAPAPALTASGPIIASSAPFTWAGAADIFQRNAGYYPSLDVLRGTWRLEAEAWQDPAAIGNPAATMGQISFPVRPPFENWVTLALTGGVIRGTETVPLRNHPPHMLMTSFRWFYEDTAALFPIQYQCRMPDMDRSHLLCLVSVLKIPTDGSPRSGHAAYQDFTRMPDSR